MVSCGACGSNCFIPGNLPPFDTVPCSKCGHPTMLPVVFRQFELRKVIASGGMGTVFSAFDVNRGQGSSSGIVALFKRPKR